ncbi:RRM domain-containing protein [Caenorhabditis elegans]|uniref:RRM domain-containing protein n=1 Tax=Caenorhabditis elegans TaxID=6239 RepID=Q21322_CAEEL|nr:RRM domain-containing protein [Caenorhabditis elegans]CCD72715.1 RRM domain-containing protein [Caenorhabditis elegans]|eukprot:NP_500504.1 RNP (RRM RNA binding domain) containing [Caenorhabditis elegans]
MAEVAPNSTLYINNLNEKIKIDELRKSLVAVFKQFGEIVSVMCFRTLKMRGQAHVIFKELPAASAAREALNGFPFYEKPMRIQFAREDSDVVAQEKGTYIKREPKYLSEKILKKPKSRKKENGGDGPAPPNKILFCTNLPDSATAEMLEIMFNQFAGLKDIRMVPNRPGIAFVEFDTDSLAIPARTTLNNFKISAEHTMRVDYAKK